MNKHQIRINKKIINIKIINKIISLEGLYGVEILRLYSNILFIKKEKNLLYFSNDLGFNDNKKIFKKYLKFKEIVERIKGLSKGYKRQLLVVGVGYKMYIEKDNILILKLGRSHNNHIYIPKCLEITSPKANTILISGNNKDNVYGMAEVIKSCKKPHVYTNKGIRNYGEIIVVKVGKKS